MGAAFSHVTSHRQAARFEKGVQILGDKKSTWWICYHYRVVVYTHCQHTFQFKQLVKVHVALYDPFKCIMSVCGAQGLNVLRYIEKP